MREQSQSNPKFLEHACIATRMIDKRRRLFDLQEKFHVEKRNHDVKLSTLKQKEDDYKRRDLDFQKSLIQFEALSKDNESAYTRATQRLAEETKLCVAVDNEIAVLLKLLDEKRTEEHSLAERTHKSKRYHDMKSSAAQLKREMTESV